MKNLIVFLFLSTQVLATQQINDKLIYEGKTYYIHPIKTDYKAARHVQATNCYRDYVATWKIFNDSFFLKKINYCNSIRRNRELENKFGIKQFVNRYTGKVIIPEYREMGKIDGNKLYENLIFCIEKGKIVNKSTTCLNEYGNLFSTGIYFFSKKDYVKALACFLETLRKHPDYFKNDYTYLYIASSLKWLGNDSLSLKYQDSVKIKFPNNIVGNEITTIMADIKSLYNKKMIVDQLPKHRCEQIILVYPWVYPPISKYSDLENVMNGSLFSIDSCPNSHNIEFTRKEYMELFQKVLKRLE